MATWQLICLKKRKKKGIGSESSLYFQLKNCDGHTLSNPLSDVYMELTGARYGGRETIIANMSSQAIRYL